LLRAAREKQGLHIAALAAAIKVAPRKLDALENDRWQELPDATFARALAQTVCRTLKIDARPVLDLLPAVAAVALEPSGGALNQPFRDRPGRSVPGFAGAAVRPMVWAAAFLMVAAVLVYFVPARWWSSATPPSGSASAPAVAATASGAAASAAVPAEPSATVSAAAAEAAGSAATVPAPAGETVFSSPRAAASAIDALAAGLVLLRSSEPSWVDVRDGQGQVLFSRTVQPGESVGLDGSLPIRLTIGNAAATQLAFRGQPINLAPNSRDNVARVELQ
jgi:cytoskeleton protein RodZ